MNNEKTTNTLTSILCSSRPENLSDYLKKNENSLIQTERPFAIFTRETIRKKGLKQQDVFLIADISEGYGYKLISEEKHTRQRDVILRLCIAAGFNFSETQKALKLYGMSPLYSRIPRDAVFIIAVNTGINKPEEVDALLKEHDFTPLYPCRIEE